MSSSNSPRATSEEREVETLEQQYQFPAFTDQTTRLKTFSDWPKTSKKSPSKLSPAGFFYIGVDERIICFSCGLSKSNIWNRRDDPWKKHALCSPNCDYLKMVKGSEFIASVKKDMWSKFLNSEWRTSYRKRIRAKRMQAAREKRLAEREEKKMINTST